MTRGRGDELAGEIPRRARFGLLSFGLMPGRRTAPRSLPPNRPRLSKRSLVFRTVAVGVAVVLTGGTLAAYAAFRHEWNGIKRVDVRPDLSFHPRPLAEPDAMNILLIGSDSRAGPNKKFGAEVAGQRSDTVMILHLSPGAHQVVVLSIPRDSVVPILKCAPEDGAVGQVAQPAGYVEQINATFAYGGPGCLWETIEQTTGIHIDDFIELTFSGFEHVINDIGGVSICLPVAIHDPDSLLSLSAGRHHVYGREALAFWRARYIGEGSDLQRINRDQYLMASLLQGIERSGLVHSPAKILQVIRDVVGHGDVATDTQLTPGRLFTIAEELHSLPPGAVQFIEIPTVPYPGDPQAWVQWAQPQATALFTAIKHDTKLPVAAPAAASKTVGSGGAGYSAEEAANGATRAAASASPAQSPVTASPALVNVAVLNGTTQPDLATTTAASLTSRGFHVVTIADAATPDYTKSVVAYRSAADLPAARAVAALIGNVTLQRNRSLSRGTVQLILGSTFAGLGTAPTVRAPTAGPTASPAASTANLAGQYGGIRGNVSICGDAAAFAGPDGTN
jgi:LCP family protein required for cell wall assembly